MRGNQSMFLCHQYFSPSLKSISMSSVEGKKKTLLKNSNSLKKYIYVVSLTIYLSFIV